MRPIPPLHSNLYHYVASTVYIFTFTLIELHCGVTVLINHLCAPRSLQSSMSCLFLAQYIINIHFYLEGPAVSAELLIYPPSLTGTLMKRHIPFEIKLSVERGTIMEVQAQAQNRFGFHKSYQLYPVIHLTVS